MRFPFGVLILLPSLVWAGPDPKVGSAFDLRRNYPAVGSKGRLVVDGDHLRFQQDPAGTRRILFGTNLTGLACFPTSDEIANRWADSLALRGYNSVRFHHIDWVIRDRGWDFKNNADRFVAALKKRGIWVTVDLYSERGDGNFKADVLKGNASVRADWLEYSKQLLTRPSEVPGCSAWKEEVAIFGICPLNEDDPRFLGVPTAKYGAAYQWMTAQVRKLGYKGFLWGLNSGISDPLRSASKTFDLEDSHIYWDHPQGDQFLNTSGVVQNWQFPSRFLPNKPWLFTEWGALPYNRLRGETGLMFACQMARYKVSGAFSFALATNEGGMSPGLSPIDQFAFHTDPVRLASERILAILIRDPQPMTNFFWDPKGAHYRFQTPLAKVHMEFFDAARRADFIGSLDGQPLTSSKRMLVVRFGDAQNSGFKSRLIKDRVVFGIVNRGKMPVVEIPLKATYQVESKSAIQAWSLDSYTGERRERLGCKQVRNGVWEFVTKSLNTEVVR